MRVSIPLPLCGTHTYTAISVQKFSLYRTICPPFDLNQLIGRATYGCVHSKNTPSASQSMFIITTKVSDQNKHRQQCATAQKTRQTNSTNTRRLHDTTRWWELGGRTGSGTQYDPPANRHHDWRDRKGSKCAHEVPRANHTAQLNRARTLACKRLASL